MISITNKTTCHILRLSVLIFTQFPFDYKKEKKNANTVLAWKCSNMKTFYYSLNVQYSCLLRLYFCWEISELDLNL